MPSDFSFTGNLSGDDDVQLFDFSVAALSTVTLRTWSYAGGTNAAGNSILAGGFDPILALFDSTGNLIDQNDDDFSGTVDPGPVTGEFFDTLLSTGLSAGDYIVSVMQYANFANGPSLSDGFIGSEVTGFVDVTGDTRTSFWAFDILNVETASTPVPEPGILALFCMGLAGFGFMRYRRYK